MNNLKERAKRLMPRGTRRLRLPWGIGCGLRMGLDLQGGHVGLYLGLYERELNRHLHRLCYRGARSFDIGGSIGYDALVMANLSGDEVLTVEASPALSERIEANVRLNRSLADRISVRCAYVDERSGAPGHVTIDELAEQFFVPDFMKVDIEGGEVAALLGAKQVLRRRRPGLVIEVHSADLEASCSQILVEKGYRPVVVNQRRFLRDHRPIPHNRWLVAPGRPARG